MLMFALICVIVRVRAKRSFFCLLCSRQKL